MTQSTSAQAKPSAAMLDGITVVEIADERAEYVGMVLAGMGADVIKVEPASGSPTRGIGPFFEDDPSREKSLFFWTYNRGKRSIALDIEDPSDRETLLELIERADILLTSTTAVRLDDVELDDAQLQARAPHLIVARMSPFGESGPWAGHKGSDLVHLALGGQTMNCGYDPEPTGRYDLPPIAPQMWHAYHIAGENLLMSILAALFHCRRTGKGQVVTCAVHEAVSKNTEIDLMSWIMRRAPVHRQTCRHAAEEVSLVPSIQQTKDGRWYMVHPAGRSGGAPLRDFLGRYQLAEGLPEEDEVAPAGRSIPGSSAIDPVQARTLELVQRMTRKFSFADYPWMQAQADGIMCAPLRKPEENLSDEHWRVRGTYSEIEHPEHDRTFTYVTTKWIASETAWRAGRRAPLLDEDRGAVLSVRQRPLAPNPGPSTTTPTHADPTPEPSMALSGVRILDFGWFLASAGATRFLAGLGAENIKVEWAAHPDTRIGAMAPVGGRPARRAATAVLQGVTDSDMGGQFNNKNAGKLGISLNVRHPEGLAIARRLVERSDIVAEGFSPGVLDKWGLGYDELRSIRPDIIYAQQSGMGSHGTYGRFRAIGPIAASLSGLSEMSGLPSPAMPAGWGYSYLDWVGAYSFASAMLGALNYRERTGKGQWIDASQTETGLFIGGTAVLDWSANGRSWERYGNRSPYKAAAPHGIFPCSGEDRWIAVACFDEAEWAGLLDSAGSPEWGEDPRFADHASRLAHQDALETAVSSWTCRHDAYELMERLQARGVPAGVCQTAEDRVETDPQLRELEWLVDLPGTKIGTWPVADLSARMSATPSHIGGRLQRGAPIYGEDNEFVYGEILGMSTAEIARLREDGAI